MRFESVFPLSPPISLPHGQDRPSHIEFTIIAVEGRLTRPGATNTGWGTLFHLPSDMTLAKVLRDTGLADRATVHGFRSAFRTWASERTSAPHAVCEMALAHRVGSDVERSTARSDLFEKRRGLMTLWAEFLSGALQWLA